MQKNNDKFKTIICGCCRNWRTRYFTITDECVFYTAHKKNYEIKFDILKEKQKEAKHAVRNRTPTSHQQDGGERP